MVLLKMCLTNKQERFKKIADIDGESRALKNCSRSANKNSRCRIMTKQSVLVAVGIVTILVFY
jgi:hypothetical protein